MKNGLSIGDMCKEIQRQQNEKADYVVDTRELEMEAGGENVVMHLLGAGQTDVVEPMNIEQLTHRQIGTQLGIPAVYYDRILQNHPDLLAHNVNTFFQREPSRRMLRTLSGSARAWLSERYRRIDNLDILEAALPAIGEMPGVIFESCEITVSRQFYDKIRKGAKLARKKQANGSMTVQF